MGKLKNLEIEANSWGDDKGSLKARKTVRKLSPADNQTVTTDKPNSLSSDDVDALSEIQGFPFIVIG